LSFAGKFIESNDLSSFKKKSRIKWAKCLISRSFPWSEMTLKVLKLEFKVENTEQYLRVVGRCYYYCKNISIPGFQWLLGFF